MTGKNALAESMFADSLLQTSWDERSKRSWTTLTSFGVQALVLGLLLLLPVLQTVGLPLARTVSTPISMGRSAPAATPTPRTGSPSPVQSNYRAGRLMLPSRIPTIISMRGDDSSQTIGDPCTTACMGIPGDPGTGIPNNLIVGTRPVLPTPPPPLPTRVIRTSSMLQGNLIRRVEPVYPPLARTARIQGSVVLVAIISKAGTIEGLHAVSGPPLLVPAAVSAVSQWRYRPYILNSEPIEVETQITVNFSLSGS